MPPARTDAHCKSHEAPSCAVQEIDWHLRAVWLTDRPLRRCMPAHIPRSSPTTPQFAAGLGAGGSGPGGAGGGGLGGTESGLGAGAGVAAGVEQATSTTQAARGDDMCAQMYTIARADRPTPLILIELGVASAATPPTLPPFFLVHACATIHGFQFFFCLAN